MKRYRLLILGMLFWLAPKNSARSHSLHSYSASCGIKYHAKGAYLPHFLPPFPVVVHTRSWHGFWSPFWCIQLFRDRWIYPIGDIQTVCQYLFVGIDSAIYVCYNGARGAPFACGSLRHKIPTRKAILRMAKSIRNANKLSYLMQRVKRRPVSIRRNKLRCSLDAHGSLNYWEGVEHLFDSREFVLLIGSPIKIFYKSWIPSIPLGSSTKIFWKFQIPSIPPRILHFCDCTCVHAALTA